VRAGPVPARPEAASGKRPIDVRLVCRVSRMVSFGVGSYDRRHNQSIRLAFIFWTSNTPIWVMRLKRRAARGYEHTREEAMAAWHRDARAGL
jgi:hypothetical protein